MTDFVDPSPVRLRFSTGRHVRWRRIITLVLVSTVVIGCRSRNDYLERVVIPTGAGFSEVADTLAARGIIRAPGLFKAYAKLRSADRRVKAGTYDLRRSARWSEVLDMLVAGRVATLQFTIPEGARIAGWTRAVGEIVGLPPDSVESRLLDPGLADSIGAPGPTLEGYLYPATYRFTPPVSLELVAAEAYRRYRRVWTPARVARLAAMNTSEQAIVTLASIIQAEARYPGEMPVISAVFHNRIERGMPLQADPTVRYALRPGAPFDHSRIDSLEAHPYNTYSNEGLPPGPIGSPDERAIDAALNPVSVPYLYFVARPDGRHEFSRTFGEHRRRIMRMRNERAGGASRQSVDSAARGREP